MVYGFVVSSIILRDSADGLTNPNMTNLAIKGIIGVKAMAEIAHALGKDSDAVSYGVSAIVTGLRQKAKLPQDQAASLFNSWLSLATSSSGSRLLGGYGNETSWSLMYNLFADKMLGLNLVPQSVSPELK